ncbi:MAG: hypothetical protein K2X48_10290 [Chitinophagaceae bacterium]|nr:hypothetical protein [Chitinophagaceae bacterium]
MRNTLFVSIFVFLLSSFKGILQNSDCSTLIALFPSSKSTMKNGAADARFPVVLTLPDSTLVWLGGLFDRNSFVPTLNLITEYPIFRLNINETVSVRIRVCDMKQKQVQQWNQAVFFDTTIVFTKSKTDKTVFLIQPRNSKKIKFENYTKESKKNMMWLYKMEPNGIWNPDSSKTTVPLKYVPKVLWKDKRFVTN